MARARNRDSAIWAIICFLFPLLGIVVLALSGQSEGSVRDLSGSVLNNEAKNKWKTLQEVDPDIRDAADRVRQLGVKYEMLLAQKYMSLNEKTYLAAAEAAVLKQADIDSQNTELNQRLNSSERSGSLLSGAFGPVALLTTGGLIACVLLFFITTYFISSSSYETASQAGWIIVIQAVFVAWIGTRHDPVTVLRQVIAGSLAFSLILALGGLILSVLNGGDSLLQILVGTLLSALILTAVYVGALFVGGWIARIIGPKRI
jgi:hypothetical protein